MIATGKPRLRGRLRREGIHFAPGLVAGVIFTLAFAPFEHLAAAFLAMSWLLWLIGKAPSPLRAGLTGWSFGFTHFATSLYWIGISFQVDAERFGSLAVPAVLGLSAFLALFPGVACAAAHRLAGGRALALWIAFAGTWSGAEWLRGHLLSGFPWNLTGYAWSGAEAPLQVASWLGVYGLGFVTVALASLPALAVARGAEMRWRLLAAGALAAGIALLWGAGSQRLADAEPAPEGQPPIRLRLVQPNVEQRLKWRPEQREAIVARLLSLSTVKGDAKPDIVLWPETATPTPLLESSTLARRIAEGLPPGTVLVTGTVRRQTAAPGALFNSVVALSDVGAVAGVYDKVRLVPFGEYVPLAGLLPIGKLTEGRVGFSAGAGPRTLSAPGVPPFQPMICYEAIFPGHRMPPPERPRWLLNVTNDAWFGESSGPYQHFQMARMRAVERGLPLVRVANSGISAVVDPYGRVLAHLPLGSRGVLDAELPPALAAPTVFERVGNLPFFAAVATSLLLGGLFGRGPRNASLDFRFRWSDRRE